MRKRHGAMQLLHGLMGDHMVFTWVLPWPRCPEEGYVLRYGRCVIVCRKEPTCLPSKCSARLLRGVRVNKGFQPKR